jgi:hypothetical protein
MYGPSVLFEYASELGQSVDGWDGGERRGRTWAVVILYDYGCAMSCFEALECSLVWVMVLEVSGELRSVRCSSKAR